MNLSEWNTIKKCAAMEEPDELPVALIVDSPWMPQYTGISTIDYFTMPEKWLEANLKIIDDFPEVIFLPGFWVEYGMAAEPSGFGCKVTFYDDTTPRIHHIIDSTEDIGSIKIPNPRIDGLMPFALNLYRNMKGRVEDAGHTIKIVAARGPFTVASHIMGLTNFLTDLMLNPQNTHKLLKMITKFIIDWLEAQADVLKTVEGIMLLDDVIGFISREDYLEFAHPYLKEILGSFPNSLKIFHNDTDNPVPYEFIEELGINIFNFTHQKDILDVRKIVGDKVCLLGNVPPLDVLVRGSADMVQKSAVECINSHGGKKGLILSAGGGTSPGTPKDNIRALINAAKAF